MDFIYQNSKQYTCAPATKTVHMQILSLSPWLFFTCCHWYQIPGSGIRKEIHFHRPHKIPQGQMLEDPEATACCGSRGLGSRQCNVTQTVSDAHWVKAWFSRPSILESWSGPNRSIVCNLSKSSSLSFQSFSLFKNFPFICFCGPYYQSWNW